MSAVSVHPVRVEGKLDMTINRWLWLVKWALAIPHFVILFFLFIAFFLATIVAAFYTYGALGTDRYPPFTLSAVPD